MWRVALLTILMLILTGCGSKYQLVKQRHAPPINASSSACLQECRRQNSACTNNCSSRFNACLDEQKQRAEADWPNQLELYNAQLQTYYAEKSLYDQETAKVDAQKNFLIKKHNMYKRKCHNSEFNSAVYCKEAESARLRLRSLASDYPDKPQKPTKRSLRQLTSEYQRRCSQECGCEKLFDICFESCGGTIETKRICISGCD